MKKIIFCLVALLSLTTTIHAQSKSAPSDKQNVLFIIVDDLNMLVESYGAEGLQTPNIDKLASEGRAFTRAYVQNPLCNPSRASIMTGKRPNELDIQRLSKSFREMYPQIETLPQYFKENGYYSAGIGKIYHNWGEKFKEGDPESWSETPFYHWAAHFHDWYVPGRPYQWHYDLKKGPAVQREDVPDEAYVDGRIANAAVNKLRELQETPFFLAVGFWKPHLPYNAPKKYWDLYDRNHLPSPPRYTAPVDGVPDLAYVNSNEARSYTDVPKEGPIPESKKLELRHGYMASISFVDAQIGKVLDELKRLNLDKKTAVVFVSDHGYHAGEHGQFGKWTTFELGTRVPFIIKTPDLKNPGKKSDSIVEMIDIYPTLVDWAGLPMKKDLSGVSLVPVLKNPEADVKPFAVSQTTRPLQGGAAYEIIGSSIRDERYRYNIWVRKEDHKIIAEELYDLSTDPFYVENIADKKGVEPIKKRMYNQLMEKIGNK
ncbi:sulfatase [Rhodohalobacter sp. 614A]|uniref:sulfatase n=1 Tax=Rhodohalobacter sp. 614A TaxID=2908649 RepID=UPI001F1D38A8|nr:sulfatase [Rhodohalobacter sp. 614A]